MAVIDNALEDVAHLTEIGTRHCKQPQTDTTIRDERRQRLVDLMRNRGGHGSHRRLLACARELATRRSQSIFQLLGLLLCSPARGDVPEDATHADRFIVLVQFGTRGGEVPAETIARMNDAE